MGIGAWNTDVYRLRRVEMMLFLIGKLIGKGAVKGTAVIAKTGLIGGAKIVTYKVTLTSGKVIFVTIKLIGAAIVGMFLSDVLTYNGY